MAAIKLDTITKVYPNGTRALSGVTLDLAEGELLALVGPSGCGKTTLLRIVAGLEKVTTGTLTFDGRIMNDIPPKDRDVAMVFQNYAVYPHMTVAQNMAFALKCRKYPKAEIDQRINETARLLKIGSLLNRRPAQLSGGERQRVALGKAMVQRPKVFLFDEPMSHLDPSLRTTMRKELKTIQKSLKTTMLYVTHDQEEALSLGDRVAVMHSGKIQQVGCPHTIFDRPVNRFVAGFIGTPPMNVIEGRIRREEDGRFQFVMGNDSIGFPQAMTASLTQYVNETMTLGIRPCHLSLGPEVRKGDSSLQVTIDVIESLGSRSIIYATTQSGEILAIEANSHPGVKIGQQTTVNINESKLHLFNQDASGTNIRI